MPIVLILGGIGVVGSDRLERENDFCNSCHLPGDTPLHLEIRQRFDRVIPRNLAGAHGRGWVEEREDPAFRCIDCHAGSGLFERGAIKILSARDGLRYLVGAFDEPERMSFELSKETCLRCHPSFRHSAAPGWMLHAYHGRPAHAGTDVPPCIRCHSVHEADGDAFAYFMSRERVDLQCRECHAVGGPMEIPSLVKK